MESTCYSVNTGNRRVKLITIYRPPDSKVLEFFNEFTNLTEYNINSSGELLLVGDFAVNKPFDAKPSTFLDILDSFNLVNKVDKPTYRVSYTLDLIIHDADSNIIPKMKVNRLFSDHNIVLFDTATLSTTTTPKAWAYRKYEDINPNAFTQDVWKSLLDKTPGTSLNDKIKYYNTTLQAILDNHAPIKSQKCSSHSKVPWFNNDITEAIRHRRHLMSNLLDKAEHEFFFTSITENSSNYKHIYDVCNCLLGRTKESHCLLAIPMKN